MPLESAVIQGEVMGFFLSIVGYSSTLCPGQSILVDPRDCQQFG